MAPQAGRLCYVRVALLSPCPPLHPRCEKCRLVHDEAEVEEHHGGGEEDAVDEV